MSVNTDDLEKTLVLAAADADSRQFEADEEDTGEVENNDEQKKAEEIRYYTQYNEDDASFQASPLKTKREHEGISIEPPKKKTHVERGNIVNKGTKRKHDDFEDHRESDTYSHSQVVATHYNLLEEKGLHERFKSRIIYLRNFHNWIKSMLINEYITKIKESKKQHNTPIRVHDMCCGKGGDLPKWKKGNISYLICSDIAEVSLDHCKGRYEDMRQRSRYERGGSNFFKIEIISADCTKVRLREKYLDPSMKLDLVSCQFAFHYSFESLAQAEGMLRNASECLQPGGYFIGTMTDANEIIARARKSGTNSFGNKVFQVTLDFDSDNPPLFGAKYNFQLDEVVDCPEFLVHFPTFVKLARRYGLKLVRKEKFVQFFQRMKDEGRQLLNNMRALEGYPPHETATLVGNAVDDYVHAKDFIKTGDYGNGKIGTLSKSEWEASSLYLTFAFVKAKNTWNADGTPCYDI